MSATMQKLMTALREEGGADVTALLLQWSGGDRTALDALFPIVYAELRRMADGRLRNEREAHTLQPTALVHEAYLRLVDQDRTRWNDRAHFFAVAAEIMRRVLVDHARKRAASKRGAGMLAVPLDDILETVAQPEVRDLELLAMDDALTRLAEVDPQQARVVELRFFAGLDVEEVATIIGVSSRTVKREWRAARAWLLSEIEGR